MAFDHSQGNYYRSGKSRGRDSMAVRSLPIGNAPREERPSRDACSGSRWSAFVVRPAFQAPPVRWPLAAKSLICMCAITCKDRPPTRAPPESACALPATTAPPNTKRFWRLSQPTEPPPQHVHFQGIGAISRPKAVTHQNGVHLFDAWHLCLAMPRCLLVAVLAALIKVFRGSQALSTSRVRMWTK